ncbi:hypothetical protein DYB31_000349 [Aphanomyces astaci]|uniref:Histone deacetylase domain-containing protein n=1 Tax=Aphanomyces astaci TaxID=112090 RepID=A0A397FGF3_APHAT|nr:hypothetical protein DYB31_000349 [Aphanomyces astaci]
MVRPSGLVLALGAVAVTIVALSISKLFSKDDGSSFEEDDESAEETNTSGSPVTKKQLVRYLNEVAETIEGIVAQLPDLAKMVMEEANALGQYVPEDQVQTILAQRLSEAVRMAEASVRVSLYPIQNAQCIHTPPPVEAAVDVPSHVTAEYTLTAMSAVLDGVGRAMEEALAEAKAAGLRDVTADAHMWQDAYVEKSTAYTAELHALYRVSEPILNAAVAKYKDNASFQAKLQTLLGKHQENLVPNGEDAGDWAQFSPGANETCLLVGGVLALVDDVVVDRYVACGYALVRPPGHDALQDMGFGNFNSIAITEHYLLQTCPSSIRKVAIVDYDVCHGNGTEVAFEDDNCVLFVSIHQANNYSTRTHARTVSQFFAMN